MVYEKRTGGTPVRVVIHKSSYLDHPERSGIRAALIDIPVVELVTLATSLLRLLRLGTYPPKVGTYCTINDARSFVYTRGFLPELLTLVARAATV